MRKLNIKGIVIVTTLSFVLTGCSTTNTVDKNDYQVPQTEQAIVEETPTQEEPTIEESTIETTPTEETQVTTFTFFEEAKQEIITYIESEQFETLKTKGKYYITTAIDFIFYDQPINGIYFNDLSEELKQDILRDVKSLDEAIMAYYPNYKETFSTKYQIASQFINEQYLNILDIIKEYLGEENYNAIGEIKDQIKEDIGEKTDELIEDIQELYKSWKNK